LVESADVAVLSNLFDGVKAIISIGEVSSYSRVGSDTPYI